MLKVADVLLSERSVASVTLYVEPSVTSAAGIDLKRHGDRVIWIRPSGTAPAAALTDAAAALTRGDLDAVLAGNQSTTSNVIRAGIAGVGLAAGVRTVSGAFIMNRVATGEVLLFADCGVVIAPTVKQLVDIASESVKTWQLVMPDAPPVVAFLSFSTKGSANHEAADKVAEAHRAFKERCPDVASDGELQFDAAIDSEIGQKKAPGSPAAGRANCFVFPDLGAGNIAYKIAQRLGGFEAYGPILQGLARPFSDLSRGSTVADILASAYINLARSGS